MSILAFGERTTNAQLMADCAALGYLPEPVIDMTYGKGRFWTEYQPGELITNDLDETRGADYCENFCRLPFVGDSFGAAVFDPPYKLNGTGGGGGPATSDADYGVVARASIDGRHALMRLGLIEAFRITRPGGFVLAKCQDQVSSGKMQWQTDMLTRVAEERGHRKVDELHVRGYRAQPAGRRQRHARRDYSTLLVFQVGS